MNHGLDDSRFGTGKALEFLDQPLKARAMGDPGLGVDRPLLDQTNNAAKVSG